MTIISKSREAIKAVAQWETSPTDWKKSLTRGAATHLAKRATSVATNTITSTIVMSGVTMAPIMGAAIAYAAPQARTAAALITLGTSAAAAGLWFFKRNHDAAVKASEAKWTALSQAEIKAKELELNKAFVAKLGGDASIGQPRIKPTELANGLFDFREESFPNDKAIVKIDNGKKSTVFGLRIQDKLTQDVYYAAVSYEGGKLKFDVPQLPYRLTEWGLNNIISRNHDRYELVAPQGKILTLLQEKVNRMEPMVLSHDRSIVQLKHSNAELKAQVETLTELVHRLTLMQEAQAAAKGATSEDTQDTMEILQNLNQMLGVQAARLLKRPDDTARKGNLVEVLPATAVQHQRQMQKEKTPATPQQA